MTILTILAGFALLIAGAEALVRGASRLAQAVGIPPLIIGLTVVAFGTSAPEFAVSVQAGLGGQADLALDNMVGSNIFNTFGVLGASAAVASQGVAVDPAALRFDIPVMTAAAVACLPVFFTGGRISRLEGMLFLAYYAAYVVFLVLQVTASPRFTTFANAMVYIVIPLTLTGLICSVLDAVRRRRRHVDASQTKVSVRLAFQPTARRPPVRNRREATNGKRH